MNAATSIAAAKTASITTASCNSRNEKTQMQLAKATILQEISATSYITQ
jgi:hypothetical protein